MEAFATLVSTIEGASLPSRIMYGVYTASGMIPKFMYFLMGGSGCGQKGVRRSMCSHLLRVPTGAD